MRSSSQEVGGERKQLPVGQSFDFMCTKVEEKEIQVTRKVNGVDTKVPTPVWECDCEVVGGEFVGHELRYCTLWVDDVLSVAAKAGLTERVSGVTFDDVQLQAIRDAKKANRRIDFEFDPMEFSGRYFRCDVVNKKPDNKGNVYQTLGKKFEAPSPETLAGAASGGVPSNDDLI